MKGTLASAVFFLLLCPSLKAEGRPASVQITCEPGVRIFIDGRFQGLTSANSNGLFVTDLPPGRHRIEAVKEGFQKYVLSLDIRGDESAREIRIPEAWVPLSSTPSRRPRAAATPRQGFLLRRFQLGLLLGGAVSSDEMFQGLGKAQGGLFFHFRPVSYVDAGIHVGVDWIPFDKRGFVEEASGSEYLRLDLESTGAISAMASARGFLPVSRVVGPYGGLRLGFLQPIGHIGTDYMSQDGGSPIGEVARDVSLSTAFTCDVFLGVEFYFRSVFCLALEAGLDFSRYRISATYDNYGSLSGTKSFDAIFWEAFLQVRIGFRFG